jgi:flagellar protein FliL
MADAKKTDAAEGEAPPKKTKLLLIIIIGLLVLVLGGGGAAFMLMKKSADDEFDDDEDDAPAKAAKAKKAKKAGPPEPPVFIKLEPFVVKLQTEQQDSYVQCIPELRVLDALVLEQIRQFMPEIRHRLLLILAGKTPADIGSPAGMQVLANQIRESINTTLSGGRSDPVKEKLDQNVDGPVIAVFFSSLVVQ